MRSPHSVFPALGPGLSRLTALAGLVLLAPSALPARQAFAVCRQPACAQAPRVGDLDPSTSLTVTLDLPLPDPAGLAAFIATLYDPQSPNYRRFLSPPAFAERFGPSASDYRTLLDFAHASGLNVIATHVSRLSLQVQGSAGLVERLFHTTLGRRRRSDGSLFYAPDQGPSVDLDLPGLRVDGLDNFARRHRHLRRHPQGATSPARRSPHEGTGGNDVYGWAYQGNDFRDAYVSGLALSGTGQSIGVIEFGGFYSQDITTYDETSKPALSTDFKVQTVLLDGYDGVPADNGDESSGGPEDDCGEVSLDIEMALAMAPQATVVSYETLFSDTLGDVLSSAADTSACAQISCSWGGGAMGDAQDVLSQMASQGQAFFCAAGDDGAYYYANAENEDEAGPVEEPESLSPYITVVGGTDLDSGSSTSPPVSYVSESAWNDYSGTCSGIVNGCGTCAGGAGSGGVCDSDVYGTSAVMDIPSYQSGVSMSDNGGSTTYRNIPDVSAVAENFWVVFCDQCPAAGGVSAGQEALPFDGTSGATPLWAAYTALVNQQAALDSKPPLGFANPALYSLAKGADYGTYFHDVQSGDNDVTNTGGASCDTVSYNAVQGYDLVTGWGSPKGPALLTALVADIGTPTFTPTFSVSPTATPTPTITQTFTYSPTTTATPTATATPTDTPSFTDSPTASATPSITQTFTVTPTPAYLASDLGRVVLAPDPARDGEPVTLYFTAQPAQTLWQVYTLAGRLVARFGIVGTGPHRYSTRDLASGIYYARVEIDYAALASQTLLLKFAVIR